MAAHNAVDSSLSQCRLKNKRHKARSLSKDDHGAGFGPGLGLGFVSVSPGLDLVQFKCSFTVN